MQIINWSGYEWMTQERWGQVHPDKWIQWYDPSAVKIDEKNRLHLYTHKNPRKFPNIQQKSPVGVGLVSNLTRFKYGRFEINAKLPKGPWLCPAFWTWSWSNWPPEFDIFEGYSGKSGNYWNFNLKRIKKPWKIETNLHWMNNGLHSSAGYDRAQLSYCKNPTKHFINYRLDWYPDKVEWWWNDRMVQKVDNQDVLKTLENTEMNVIINNAIMWDMDLENPTHSDFIINWFKWTPL